MRIPLTKYGWPQVAVYPVVVIAAMLGLFLGAGRVLPPVVLACAEAVLLVVLIWVLSFFRDPRRECPDDGKVLVAPADGRVTDIDEMQEESFIEGPALRIGIFLSIFNTHINRSPCDVNVEKTEYRKGAYRNALNPESARVNESNSVCLVRTERPRDRLVVRQISGAIARRIVCDAGGGERLAAGQKFGMIKFGSRTELYVPCGSGARCLVGVGDKVKAGLTPLVRYE